VAIDSNGNKVAISAEGLALDTNGDPITDAEGN